jgi:PAS domain S-box-containing protein
MTPIVAALLGALAIQTAAIAALLVQRRALRRSEAFFRQVADEAPVIMWTTRLDSTVDYLNKVSVEFTGMPLRELLDQGWLNAVHPDDRNRIQGIYVAAVEARQPVVMEYRLRRADGIYRWVLDSGVPKLEEDGRYTGYIGCCIDITERRAAEEALRESHGQVRHLAGRLIEAQDAERARLARDLHDDVSQELAGVSIALSALTQRLGASHGGEDLHRDLVELQQQTLAIARGVRHLSHDLHPTVLQHLGLVKGLTSYCGELERAYGLSIACTAEGDFSTMTSDSALCIYRIAQEALRNVIAHATASRADVRLRHSGEHAHITITDDGRGFDVDAVGRRHGLGLVSINERAALAGGTTGIESGLNQGTRVQATIPVAARSTPAMDTAVRGPGA